MSKVNKNLDSQRSSFFLMTTSLNFNDDHVQCSEGLRIHSSNDGLNLFTSWCFGGLLSHLDSAGPRPAAQLCSSHGGRARASGTAFILQCFGLSLRKEDAQVPISDLIWFQCAIWNEIISVGDRGLVLPLKCSISQQVPPPLREWAQTLRGRR